jgi:hypothetical protein
MSQISTQVGPRGNLIDPCPSPIHNPTSFRRHSGEILKQFLSRSAMESSKFEPSLELPDTLLIPMIQARPLEITQEQDLMNGFWLGIKNHLTKQQVGNLPWNLLFTSGYFNISDSLSQILCQLGIPVTILTASPQVRILIVFSDTLSQINLANKI